MEYTYNKSFRLIGRGIQMLSVCTGRTVANSIKCAFKDCVHGVIKHPLVFITLLALYAACLVTNAKAKAERDHSCMTAYLIEQQRDSLQIILGSIRAERQ